MHETRFSQTTHIMPTTKIVTSRFSMQCIWFPPDRPVLASNKSHSSMLLPAVSALQKIPRMHSLKLLGCSFLADISPFSHCLKLKHVVIGGCRRWWHWSQWGIHQVSTWSLQGQEYLSPIYRMFKNGLRRRENWGLWGHGPDCLSLPHSMYACELIACMHVWALAGQCLQLVMARRIAYDYQDYPSAFI